MEDLAYYYRAIKSGSFEIACHRLKLLLAPAYEEVCFEGSGLLRFIPTRGIDVVMVGEATRTCILDLSPILGNDDEWGQYQVRAWDCRGREWVGSDWVRPRIHSDLGRTFGGRSPVELRATLTSIATTDIDDHHDVSRAAERYEFIVPAIGRVGWQDWTHTTTTNGAGERRVEGRADHYRCELNGILTVVREGSERDSAHVTITPTAADQLPPFVDMQALQALQFMTARTLNFGIQYRRGAHQRFIRLVGPVLQATSTRIPPPCQLVPGLSPDNEWQVFRDVFLYLLAQDCRPLFHPLIDTLLLVMDASRRSWNNCALTLAVGVEAAAQQCRRCDRSAVDPAISREELKAIRKHFAEFKGSEQISNRVNGFLGALRGWTARDRLHKLQRLGILTRSDIEAWKELRNPAAHGYSTDGQSPDDQARGVQVLTMLYKIILGEAGYSGSIVADC